MTTHPVKTLQEELGIKVLKSSEKEAEVARKTNEMDISCRVEDGPRRKLNIDTGLDFFNHMIEMLSYYTELNIDLAVKVQRFRLAHTIIEDSGLTLGRAFYEIAVNRIKKTGIKGFGFAQCILDEAFVQARVTLEGRAGCYVTRDARRFGLAEGVQEEFMESFFQGFSQRMLLTVHLDLVKGDDPHHLWEAAFRAFGDSLRQLLEPNEWRKGGIAGIKGTLD